MIILRQKEFASIRKAKKAYLTADRVCRKSNETHNLKKYIEARKLINKQYKIAEKHLPMKSVGTYVEKVEIPVSKRVPGFYDPLEKKMSLEERKKSMADVVKKKGEFGGNIKLIRENYERTR